MPKFYVTYGSNTKQAKKYSVLETTDYVAARQYLYENIGNKFAFCYAEEDWQLRGGITQAEKYGLQEIPLQAQEKNYD